MRREIRNWFSERSAYHEYQISPIEQKPLRRKRFGVQSRAFPSTSQIG